MPIPSPHDGDAQSNDALGRPTNRRAPDDSEQDWAPIAGRPGWFTKGDRLKYDPFQDPQHPCYRSKWGMWLRSQP